MNNGKTFDQIWKSITGVPAVDFKDKRHTAVNYQEDGRVVSATAAGHSIGIIYEPNNVDEPAQVVASGYAFVRYGAAVKAGQALEVGTGGKLIPLATGVKVGIAAVSGPADSLGTVFLG